VILRVDRRLLLNVDWLLLGAAALLIALGMVSMWNLAPGGTSASIAWRQLSGSGSARSR
jgi:hypothetical protein